MRQVWHGTGPTSEIFYDRGPAIGRDGGPAVDSERFVELWNLVFMQYQRGSTDEEILGDLPGRHIDTGLGRDRLAMLLQGVGNLQETAVVRPTLRAVREATGRDDGPAAHRLVTDHLRTAVFLISAGVRPGNEGRRYVVRRLLRRAVRRLVLLGVDEPVLGTVADSVTEVPGGTREVVEREERAFRRTLRAGNRLLDTELSRGPLRGETVFKLHDTYGFPVDFTVEIAREHGVSVDTDGFARLMREHRERSRAQR
ncbi:alanine--tRNA ligase-related protein [Plantactinospora sp. DSM 117369]